MSQSLIFASSIVTGLISVFVDELITKTGMFRGSLAHCIIAPIICFIVGCINVFFRTIIKKRKFGLSKRSYWMNILCGFVFAVQMFASGYSRITYPTKIILASSKLLIGMPTNAFLRSRKKKASNGSLFGYSQKELFVSIVIFLGILLILLPPKFFYVEVFSKQSFFAIKFKWWGLLLYGLSVNIGGVFEELQNHAMEKEREKHADTDADNSDDVTATLNMLSSIFFIFLGSMFNGLGRQIIVIAKEDKRTIILSIVEGVMIVLTQFLYGLVKQKLGVQWKNIALSLKNCLSVVVCLAIFRDPTVLVQKLGIAMVMGLLVFIETSSGATSHVSATVKTSQHSKVHVLAEADMKAPVKEDGRLTNRKSPLSKLRMFAQPRVITKQRNKEL